MAFDITRDAPDSNFYYPAGTGYQINYPAGTGYRRIHGYLLHDSQFFVCLHYSVL